MEDSKIINNTILSRFELLLPDGEFAVLQYRFYKDKIALMHTHVPENMKGKGIGAKLVVAALHFAIEQNKKVMLYCFYAAKYVKEHPEFHACVDAEFHPGYKH